MTQEIDQNFKNEFVENHEIDIPQKDYTSLSPEKLTAELKFLMRNFSLNKIKTIAHDIKEAFQQQFIADTDEKKKNYLAEGGLIQDFAYHPVYQRDFEIVWNDYREKLKLEQIQLEQNNKENLAIRLTIIEELKALYTQGTDNHHNTFKAFRELKERWLKAGSIPKNEMDRVYKTYHHHLDNYYTYLDLNRELREMEYKHNLEQKDILIAKAHELQHELNIQKALNELQFLHKMWREIGPVEIKIREEKWLEFKQATEIIQDKRQELHAQIELEIQENFVKKQAVLEKIKTFLAENKAQNHQEWNTQIIKLEDYKRQFTHFIGRVNRKLDQTLWEEYKGLIKDFNHRKNAFYRDIKHIQQTNLEQKIILLDKAKALSNSTDWEVTYKKLAQIQQEWKKIGHVPRNHTEKIWQEFKDACNHFFNRYHELKETQTQHQKQEIKAHKDLIETIKSTAASADEATVVAQIEDFNKQWKTLSKKSNLRELNQQYHKAIDHFLKQTNLNKTILDNIRQEVALQQIIETKDAYKLEHEIRECRKQINDIEREIVNLENNLAFVTNLNTESELFKSVQKNIATRKANLAYWQHYYTKLIRTKIG